MNAISIIIWLVISIACAIIPSLTVNKPRSRCFADSRLFECCI